MDGISWWSEDILRQTTSGSRQNSLNSNSLSLEQEQQHLGRHFLIEYHGEGGVHYGNFNKCKELVNDDLKNLG